jgi:hypothetical protein
MFSLMVSIKKSAVQKQALSSVKEMRSVSSRDFFGAYRSFTHGRGLIDGDELAASGQMTLALSEKRDPIVILRENLRKRRPHGSRAGDDNMRYLLSVILIGHVLPPGKRWFYYNVGLRLWQCFSARPPKAKRKPARKSAPWARYKGFCQSLFCGHGFSFWRRDRKNSCNNAAHSPASTPPVRRGLVVIGDAG